MVKGRFYVVVASNRLCKMKMASCKTILQIHVVKIAFIIANSLVLTNTVVFVFVYLKEAVTHNRCQGHSVTTKAKQANLCLIGLRRIAQDDPQTAAAPRRRSWRGLRAMLDRL